MRKEYQHKLLGLVFFQVLYSIIGLFNSQNLTFPTNLSDTSVSPEVITLEAAIVIVLSCLGFVCAYGLWKWQRWAWFTALTIQIIQILVVLNTIEPKFESIIASTTVNPSSTSALSLFLIFFVIHSVLSITILQSLFVCRKVFQ